MGIRRPGRRSAGFHCVSGFEAAIAAGGAAFCLDLFLFFRRALEQGLGLDLFLFFRAPR